MTVPGQGLRERKKQRTRETIVRAALRLFGEHGYETTTIADIAEAADIAPRTFFAYFPSKEEVVFHDFGVTLERFSARLAERDTQETTFDALRAWIVDTFTDLSPLDAAQERLRRRIIRDTPALRAHERTNFADIEAVLVQEIARDLGVAPGALRPHLVGAAATAALEALGSFYDERPRPGPEKAAAVLDEAFVFLRGGLEALRRHPAV